MTPDFTYTLVILAAMVLAVGVIWGWGRRNNANS